MGDVLWRRTSTMRTRSPIKGVSGRCTPHGRVYYLRGETVVFRPMKMPRDPKTQAQVLQRQRWGKAVGNWQNLTMQVRRDWQYYALSHFFRLQYVIENAGLNTYTKVQMLRQAMGLELSQTAPQAPPPPAIIRLEQAASLSQTTYSFRLEHHLADVAGVRVLVELTPAMRSLARKPREQELRWACGCSAQSLVPLGQSGSVVTVTSARFSVAEGQRYGVRIRLVSPEGVPGPALMTNFIRLGEHEPDPPPPPKTSRSIRRARLPQPSAPLPTLDPLEWQELYECLRSRSGDRQGAHPDAARPTHCPFEPPHVRLWLKTAVDRKASSPAALPRVRGSKPAAQRIAQCSLPRITPQFGFAFLDRQWSHLGQPIESG